jgi:hypothetical protein
MKKSLRIKKPTLNEEEEESQIFKRMEYTGKKNLDFILINKYLILIK